MVGQTLNKQPDALVLVFGQKAKGLEAAIIFGTSMWPFIPSGAELQLEAVSAQDIGVGDIVSFFLHPDVSVTHRVVRVLRNGSAFSFLTKGDNRLIPDAVISHDKILGRVIRVGETDIRFFAWRVLGWIVAGISHGQFLIWRRLADSPLNGLRHRLEQKGIFPRIHAKWWLKNLTNPVAWLTRLILAGKRLNLLLLRGQLLCRGIHVQRSCTPDTPAMIQILNEEFPGSMVSAGRFTEGFFAKSRDQTPLFFLIKSSKRLLGWALATPDGEINIFVLSAEGWQAKAGPLLFDETLAWFRKKKVRQIFLNVQLDSMASEGIVMTPLLAMASEVGFEPNNISYDLVVSAEAWRRPQSRKAFEDCTVRSCHEADSAAVADFFRRNGSEVRANLFLKNIKNMLLPPGKGILVASSGDFIIGFLRYVCEGSIDYAELPWSWIFLEPSCRWGYLSWFLVDKAHRGRGIEVALAQAAFESLSCLGCRQIYCGTERRGLGRLYHRFGFRECRRFVRLRRLEKE